MALIRIMVFVLIFCMLSATVFAKPIADNVPELQQQVKNARWIAKVFGIIFAFTMIGLIAQESTP